MPSCCNQVPAVSQLSLLDGNGREQLRLSRTAIAVSSGDRFFPRPRVYRSRRPRRQLRAGLFPGRPALHVDRGVAFRLQCRRHHRRNRSSLPVGFPRRRPGRQGRLRLCGRPARPGAGEFGQGPRGRQGCLGAAAGRRAADAGRPGAGLGHRHRRPCGADRVRCRAEARLARVLRAADRAGAGADPRPAAADRAADRARPGGRDPRRHAAGAPDADSDHRACARGARRLGAGDFSHRIEVHTADELEELADQFNSMAGPAARNLFGPRIQGRGAHPRSRAIDQRAQGARGSRPRGRLLARSQRRAADGGGARARNHPCRRGADLRL